jgi:hypothetical protein
MGKNLLAFRALSPGKHQNNPENDLTGTNDLAYFEPSAAEN